MSVSRADKLDERNERYHDDNDGEHEPTDALRPGRVDVVTERDRWPIHDREHEQKLLSNTRSQQSRV